MPKFTQKNKIRPKKKSSKKLKPKTEVKIFVNSTQKTPHFRKEEVNIKKPLSIQSMGEHKGKSGVERFDRDVDVRRQAYTDSLDAVKSEIDALKKKWSMGDYARKVK